MQYICKLFSELFCAGIESMVGLYEIITIENDILLHAYSYSLNLYTAPCVPQNVSLEPLCDSSGMKASWSHSVVAKSYSLVAVGGDGDVRTCTSTTNNCTLSHLHCGQLYNVNITASAGDCVSLASQQVTFHTGEAMSPKHCLINKKTVY